MKNRWLGVALIVGLILISLGIRVVHLKADPPHMIHTISNSVGIAFDEGTYAVNARNKILYGQWLMDEWNAFIFNAPLAFIYYISFLIFGVNITVVKLINVALSLVTIFFVFLILRKKFNLWLAFSLSLIFSCNFYYLVYNRAGLLGTFTLLCQVLTCYFLIQSQKKESLALWVGFFGFLAAVTKPIYATFFIAALISVAMIAWTNKRKTPLIRFAWGSIPPLALWILLIYIPYAAPYNKIALAMKKLSGMGGIKTSWINIQKNLIPKIFSLYPILLLMAILFISLLLFKLVRRQKIQPEHLLVLLWSVSHFLAVGIMSYRPFRYHFPFILAFHLAMFFLIELIQKEKPKPLPILLISLGLILLFFRNLWPYLFSNPIFFSQYPFPIRLLIFTGLLTVIACLFLYHHKPQSMPILLTLMLAPQLLASATLYTQHILHPAYRLERMSNYVKTLPPGTVLMGQNAVRLTFDSPHRGIQAAKTWWNDENPFQHNITHVVTIPRWTYELSWIKKDYPNIFKTLKLLQEFPYWTKKIQIYRLVK